MRTNRSLSEDIEIDLIGEIINPKPNIDTSHTNLTPNMRIIRNTKFETQTQNPKPKVEIIRKTLNLAWKLILKSPKPHIL